MTRIVLAFMLVLAFQAVSADVLIIDEVRQADSMHLPKNGQSKADIETYLGPPTFNNDITQQGVGVVTGLAWTSVGGELLTIEAVAISTSRCIGRICSAASFKVNQSDWWVTRSPASSGLITPMASS